MSTQNENILDVTILAPRDKHPEIFNRYDHLKPGESLVILNDHNPKPLYYQMMAERGKEFSWTYLEEGPEWWKVRITKLATPEQGETIGEIASKSPESIAVFRKYGLDFCCGGKKTLKEACNEKNLDLHSLETELQASAKQKGSALPYDQWSPDFLADFIVNTHHSYVTSTLPVLREYSEKVLQVHGDRHPELEEVRDLILGLEGDLNAHLAKEERILFPYIKRIIASGGSDLSTFQSPFGTVNNPIRVMEMEHEVAGEILEKLQELTSDFTPPEDACASYQFLYKTLREFMDDLHLHIHLENNILFPKAIELESNLVAH